MGTPTGAGVIVRVPGPLIIFPDSTGLMGSVICYVVALGVSIRLGGSISVLSLRIGLIITTSSLHPKVMVNLLPKYLTLPFWSG